MSPNRVLESFRELTGHAASGAWFAPGRVNLIGEHTDYSEGYSLPIAIELGTSVALAPRTDSILRAYSLDRPGESLSISIDELKPHQIDNWIAYPASVIWAFQSQGHQIGGLDVVVASDLPIGAGLSSSAALICAVAIACAELFEIPVSRPGLVSVAQQAERRFVGVPVGILDQTASLLCEADCALLLDSRDRSAAQIPLATEEQGLTLLVLDTRTPRELRDGGYSDRQQACSQAARLLGLRALRDLHLDELDRALVELGDETLANYTRHVVTENARVLEAAKLLELARLDALGPLLTESHESLRIDFAVSTPTLDAIVESALSAGALGARMTGAGFGGAALALVHSDDLDKVSAAVAREARKGGDLPPPRTIPVRPSEGARRIA